MSSIRRDWAHPRVPVGDLPAGAGGMGEAVRHGTLSIIIPARDEAANLPELVEEVVGVFRALVGRLDRRHPLDAFEILVVDDGSTDATSLVLRQLAGRYPELRTITLASNVGQSAATASGFWAARGDWIGLLDADLQNPPADLAELWQALPGFDAALGWRATRQDDWVKRITSRLANRVRNAVLGQSIRDTGCSIRIFPRRVALRLPMFLGAHRFLGPLLIREGCRIVQKPVGHRRRASGKSHYHLGNRSIRVVVDLLGVAWLLRRPIRRGVVLWARPDGRLTPVRMAEGREASR
jgi:dolichol-phosphate mannosyltransferase